MLPYDDDKYIEDILSPNVSGIHKRLHEIMANMPSLIGALSKERCKIYPEETKPRYVL